MDYLKKLYILLCCIWDGVTGGYQYWKTEIYPNGLDDYECCNGGTGSHNICGCGGATIRKTWFNKSEK